MNQKDKDFFKEYMDAKIDPLHADIKEQKEWLMSNTRRLNELDTKVASNRWHDWAIKGGIVGMAGLFMEALARAMHK